jgi:hypothetical protein
MDVRQYHRQPLPKNAKRWIHTPSTILFRENFRAAVDNAEARVIVMPDDGLDDPVCQVKGPHCVTFRVAN